MKPLTKCLKNGAAIKNNNTGILQPISLKDCPHFDDQMSVKWLFTTSQDI